MARACFCSTVVFVTVVEHWCNQWWLMHLHNSTCMCTDICIVHCVLSCTQMHPWRTVHKKAAVSVQPGTSSVGVDRSYLWHSDASSLAWCYTPSTVQHVQATSTACAATERRILLVSCSVCYFLTEQNVQDISQVDSVGGTSGMHHSTCILFTRAILESIGWGTLPPDAFQRIKCQKLLLWPPKAIKVLFQAV